MHAYIKSLEGQVSNWKVGGYFVKGVYYILKIKYCRR